MAPRKRLRSGYMLSLDRGAIQKSQKMKRLLAREEQLRIRKVEIIQNY